MEEVQMRVMVIVKATKESEAESNPLEMEGAEEMFEQMGKYNEELIKAGIMLAGDGLKPSRFGKRIHFDGTKRSVTDGPFAETKELVAGYWIWDVKSVEDAVQWAKLCPNPMPGEEGILEIRPVYSLEEFEHLVDKDDYAKQKRLQKEVARQNKPRKAKRKAKKPPARKKPARRAKAKK